MPVKKDVHKVTDSLRKRETKPFHGTRFEATDYLLEANKDIIFNWISNSMIE